MDDDLWLERNNARKTSVLSPLVPSPVHTAVHDSTAHRCLHFISHNTPLSIQCRAMHIKPHCTLLLRHFAAQRIPPGARWIELHGCHFMPRVFAFLTLLLPSHTPTCHSNLYRLD